MNSEKSGRKTWVKRAIEIFLVVLILLTFFSNTIMNASLAQVTVQKIQSGTIQEAVRGSGIVKAEEAHEMKAEKQWDVKEVRKKSGDSVEQGEVLFVVKSETEMDVDEAREQLEQLEYDYTKLVVESGISSAEKKNLEEHGLTEEECMAQLEAAEEDKREELRTKILKQLDIVRQWRAIGKIKEELAREESGAGQIEIASPVSGILQQINVIANQIVEPDYVMAVIWQKTEQKTVSFLVSAEDAAKVKKGDRAEIVSPRNLKNTTVALKSIVEEQLQHQWAGLNEQTENMNEQKEGMHRLTFEITGELGSGQSVTLLVEQSKDQYDFVVPNSAVQSDKDGKFLLVIRTRNSPLGNRYYTERVPIEVQASDETSVAVSGALYGNEYVVITSNFPLEGGGQVRLMDSVID